MTTIYRFKFTAEFAIELSNFAKIHELDDRKDFKEAWSNWTEENNEIIEEERRLHEQQGYTGNMMDKMYKSVRYYYRKKDHVKKEPVKRREYMHVGKEVLNQMNEFIKKNIDLKPSDGFEMYYNEEQSRRTSSREEEEIFKSMLKKTYKNRCYIINRKK